VPQVVALRKRWLQCPPLDRSIAAYIGYKPPVEITDLPEGSFAQAKAANDDWFRDPARFFPALTTQVKTRADGNG
jgi:hypothetical protein